MKQNEVNFERVEFKTVSPECIDLIKWLLQKDPHKRPTASEAMRHPWFKTVNDIKDDPERRQKVLKRFNSFKGRDKFQKAALNLLVKTIKQDELVSLRQVF